MKFLELSQVIRTEELDDGGYREEVSKIFINKDMIKFIHMAKPNGTPPITRIGMVGNAATIDVMETPAMIEKMCQDIIGVKIVRTNFEDT